MRATDEKKSDKYGGSLHFAGVMTFELSSVRFTKEYPKFSRKICSGDSLVYHKAHIDRL